MPESVAPYMAFRELIAPLDRPTRRLPRPARILDIGAGAGAYGELLDRWWPGRFDYVGADYSDEILALARGRWPGRTFLRKDVFEPGALDGYDIVMASALLDVLPEVEPGLDALLGCGRPLGGAPSPATRPATVRTSRSLRATAASTRTARTSRGQQLEEAARQARPPDRGRGRRRRRRALVPARSIVITLFSIPKAFVGQRGDDSAQRASELDARSTGVQVILLGEARPGRRRRPLRSERRTSPRVRRASSGRRGSTMRFARVDAIAKHRLRCFVNGDIILLDDFLPAVRPGPRGGERVPDDRRNARSRGRPDRSRSPRRV